jgi:small-conductance mechanosensitive channel
VTTLSVVGDVLVTHQILLSVLISAALIALIWRADILLSRYSWLSTETIQDICDFRRVTAVTVFVGALVWIHNQPLPEWFADPFVRARGPEIAEGIVEFLPAFLVSRSDPILVTVLGFWWTWRLRATGDDIIERFVAQNYDEKLAPIVENVWDVTIVAIFVFLVLDQWGISAATLLAPAGVIGIIVGFSARETVANFFGSISLYADETYTRGDFIELESGVSGTVRDISVRSTVLQTLDGDLVTIPNSTLNNAKIHNKSAPVPNRRIQSRVGVSYDADPERVKDVLRDAAAPVSVGRDPQAHLRVFGDSALVFEVFVWIDAPEDRRKAEDELNTAIYRAMADADIEIPFPQQEVTVERESSDSTKG